MLRTRTPSSRLLLAASGLVLLARVSAPGPAAAAPFLYGVSADDTLLRTIDASDAQTVDSVTMTLAGETIQGATGLARNPDGGDLYALLKLQGQSGNRELVTVDPDTGVATSVGSTGDSFAGLAFIGTTLYGVTGDGAGTPETLFSLSLLDGSATSVLTLGNGGSGETLGSVSGVLYHGSGPLGDEVFERVDLGAGSTTGIPLSGDAYDEAGALTNDGAGNLLLADVFGTDLYGISTSGVVSLIGDLGFSRPKGLVFVPEPSTALLLALGLTVLARRRARPQ